MNILRLSQVSVTRLRSCDRVLVLSLTLAAVLGVNGLGWGGIEEWNPDQMAFQSLLSPDRAPLEPESFLKPPFHSYVNFFFSIVPVKAIERAVEALTGRELDFNVGIVWGARLIQLGLFLGAVILVYQIVHNSCGQRAARVVGLITATAAGFVLQAHFRTADIPVTFWMLASFLAAQSIPQTGRTRDYALAGLLTGVASATKYNGLAVGLAIPIFHYFANRSAPLRTLAVDRRLLVGILLVPLGFIAANPYRSSDSPGSLPISFTSL